MYSVSSSLTSVVTINGMDMMIPSRLRARLQGLVHRAKNNRQHRLEFSFYEKASGKPSGRTKAMQTAAIS